MSILSTDVRQTISESGYPMEDLKECRLKRLKRQETLEFDVILCRSRRHLRKQCNEKLHKENPLNEGTPQ